MQKEEKGGGANLTTATKHPTAETAENYNFPVGPAVRDLQSLQESCSESRKSPFQCMPAEMLWPFPAASAIFFLQQTGLERETGRESAGERFLQQPTCACLLISKPLKSQSRPLHRPLLPQATLHIKQSRAPFVVANIRNYPAFF